MSAYVVSHRTISAIVHGARMFDYMALNEVDPRENPDKVGQILLDMNIDSVNARYGESNPYEPYRFHDEEFDLAQIWGSCSCYSYQACETRSYYETEIPNWLKQLRMLCGKRAVEELCGEIPWGLR